MSLLTSCFMGYHVDYRLVSSTAMKSLPERFGNFQLIELTGTIGYYTACAR